LGIRGIYSNVVIAAHVEVQPSCSAIVGLAWNTGSAVNECDANKVPVANKILFILFLCFI
jgi:hypothetical protein